MNVDESKYKILMDLYRSTKPMAIDKSEALSFLIEERYVKKVRNHGDYDESYTNGHEDQYTLTNQGKKFLLTQLDPQAYARKKVQKSYLLSCFAIGISIIALIRSLFL
ncbi:hypothetical protein ATW97_03940 [Oenococcus oeni]|nr:hypothetical protein [Oenococcus oeni]KDE87043.1 hypothetical protein EL27_00775 [Oenococcus oeni]KGH71783.1 hypothetical protein X280_07495 [Oenococcus oeni IOEB_0502]MDV7714883.1 hypothetical protein [Oenococcus oeni]OIL20892.1 hypothetical protein ATW99_04080 [Oenococcus oeni]OIL25841.1 hypothetical protein ATX01_04410 [Oenococcus oeni]